MHLQPAEALVEVLVELLLVLQPVQGFHTKETKPMTSASLMKTVSNLMKTVSKNAFSAHMHAYTHMLGNLN